MAGGVAMGVVEAATLVACGTLAAIVVAFFAEARRRRSTCSGGILGPKNRSPFGVAGPWENSKMENRHAA